MARKLDDVLERLGKISSFDGLEGEVLDLRNTFDVEHVVFHAVKATGERWGAVSYDASWVQTYMEENFQLIDPVVHSCFRKFTPSDWKRLDWSGKPARALLAEGISHGIGNQGFSMPVRGPNGQFRGLHPERPEARRRMGGFRAGRDAGHAPCIALSQ